MASLFPPTTGGLRSSPSLLSGTDVCLSFTVGADASAVKIWYPQKWNDAGTEMVAGEPLLIEPIDPSLIRILRKKFFLILKVIGRPWGGLWRARPLERAR